jgi:hypothetical protein
VHPRAFERHRHVERRSLTAGQPQHVAIRLRDGERGHAQRAEQATPQRHARADRLPTCDGFQLDRSRREHHHDQREPGPRHHGRSVELVGLPREELRDRAAHAVFDGAGIAVPEHEQVRHGLGEPEVPREELDDLVRRWLTAIAEALGRPRGEQPESGVGRERHAGLARRTLHASLDGARIAAAEHGVARCR